MKFLLFLMLFSLQTKWIMTQRAKLDVQRMTSDKPCRNSADCEKNSYCNEQKRCKCEENYIIVKNQTNFSYKCLKLGDDLNSPCEEDIQCEFILSTSSYCNREENACTCKNGTHFDKAEGRCFITTALGGKCIESRQCLNPDGGYAYCIGGKCECDDTQYLTEKGNCVRKINIGQPCEKDENCAHANGICTEVCKCSSKYVMSGTNETCLKAAFEIGDNCTELAQCTSFLTDAICANDTCICPRGKHAVGSTCYKSSQIGQDCTDKQQCWIDGLGRDDVNCVTRTCQCINDKCRNINSNIPDSGISPYVLIYLIIFEIVFIYLL